MNTGIALAATLFLGLFYNWTSRLNGIFFFGRSLSPDLKTSAEAQAITRQYRLLILGATLLAAGLSLFGGVHNLRLGFAAPLLLVVCFSFAFAYANGRARSLESTSFFDPTRSMVEVDLAAPPSYRVPGWGIVLLPVEISLAAFGLCLLFTPHPSGLGNAWQTLNQSFERSKTDFLFGMGTGMLSSATLLLLLLKTSARLRTRMAQYSIHASMVMQWIGATLLLALLILSSTAIAVPHAATKGIVIVGVLAALTTVVWNQRRSAQFVPPAAEMGADDRWRWGLFYVDKADPALFVQSRCGAGYSLNYGKMLAWPIALALVAYFISIIFLVPLHR